MAAVKRDGSSYTWSSQEHSFVTGQVLGTLLKDGYEVEPGMTENEDYTASITLRRHGKTFRLIVAEVED